jgi:hypothetical protein
MVALSVGLAASTGYGQLSSTVPAPAQGAGLTPNPLTSRAPSQSGLLPKQAQQYSQEFKLIHEEDIRSNGRKLTLDGAVIFEYHGYRVTCDHMVGDQKTHIFLLQGHATLKGSDATVSGDRIVVDYPNEAFQAFRSKADLKPSLVGGELQGDVYVTDLESHGTQNDFFASTGTLTTCDLEHPHYDLDSNDIEVRYGVRAILRRAVLRLFGTKIATLPYVVIPLDDRSYRNLPEMGYDVDEGYFIKTRYGIPLTGDRALLTHLDYMSALGLGLGADYQYRQPDQNGTASVYGIGGSWNQFSFSNDHQQTFKFGTFSLNDDYENNNYLIDPGETSFNMRGSLALPQGARGNTLISFTDATTQATSFDSSSETLGVTDDRKLTQNLHTNLGLNYSGSSSSYSGAAETTQEDLNVKLQADDNLKQADLGLEYLRDVPIGDNANFTSGNDITPEVSLTSDASKLVGRKLAQELPFHTEISWGDFSNGINGGGPIGRTEFDFSLQKPDLSKNKFTANWNAEFKQTFYTDSTAQYVLNFGSDLKYAYGKDTYTDLRYSYSRPYGYSPLTIDQTGDTNLVTLDTSVRPIPSLLTGLQTGYDIDQLQMTQEPWQPLGFRTEYTLQNYFSLRGLETYDPTQNAWTSVRLDLTYKPGATLLAIGSAFDGIRHTWTSVNISLTSLKIGRTKFSTILAFDGYTQRFDTQQYNVVYDLHCAEAVFSVLSQADGFRPGNQYEFFIRLKAIPFDGNFGLGTRGQSITSNTGL